MLNIRYRYSVDPFLGGLPKLLIYAIMDDVICVLAIPTPIADTAIYAGMQSLIRPSSIIPTTSKRHVVVPPLYDTTSTLTLVTSNPITPCIMHASPSGVVPLTTHTRTSHHYRCITFHRSHSLPVRIEILPRHVSHRSVTHTSRLLRCCYLISWSAGADTRRGSLLACCSGPVFQLHQDKGECSEFVLNSI